MLPRRDLRVDNELRKVYEEVPSPHCQGLCVASCGPIAMPPYEAARFAEAADRAGVLYDFVPLGDEYDSLLVRTLEDGFCPALSDDGRCRVYNARPFVCRAWGASEVMPCVYGCRPDRVLTEGETVALLRRTKELGS